MQWKNTTNKARAGIKESKKHKTHNNKCLATKTAGTQKPKKLTGRYSQVELRPKHRLLKKRNLNSRSNLHSSFFFSLFSVKLSNSVLYSVKCWILDLGLISPAILSNLWQDSRAFASKTHLKINKSGGMSLLIVGKNALYFKVVSKVEGFSLTFSIL